MTKWVNIPRDHLHNMKKYINSKLEDDTSTIQIVEQSVSELTDELKQRIKSKKSDSDTSALSKLSILVLRAIKTVPITLIHRCIIHLQRNDPKDMWHLLKRLSFTEGKAKLA